MGCSCPLGTICRCGAISQFNSPKDVVLPFVVEYQHQENERWYHVFETKNRRDAETACLAFDGDARVRQGLQVVFQLSGIVQLGEQVL